MPRRLPRTLPILAALLCAVPAVAGPRYNLLLVSLDSVRRDALGCYGHRPLHAPALSPSPSLDALAAGGVRFTEAYATAPWTLPSHVSLLTGQPTAVHQVEVDLQRLATGRPTLAGILRANGWHTAGVYSGPYLEPWWGLDRGFERYHEAYGQAMTDASALLAKLGARIDRMGAAGDRHHADALEAKRRRFHEYIRRLSAGDVSSERVTAAALEELDDLARSPAPWFLFAHYFDPHYDYIPPAPWDTRFDPDYTGTVGGHGYFSNPAVAVPDPADPDGWLRRAPERDLEHLRALYDGEVGWADAHVGRLLARLDALGLAGRTLVVVVSDHGDEFFEHGGIGHHRTLYEEVLQIPVILRLPGVLPAGRAVGGLVSIADVLPTVLELLGVPPPPDLASASAVPLVRGDTTAGTRAILSRLVRMREGTLTIDGRDKVSARVVVVDEAFRRGPIKILRRRTWPSGSPGLPADLAGVLRTAGDDAYRHEDLRWIDLGRSPGEAAADFSDRFDDPAARAALDAFTAAYPRLAPRAATRAAPGNGPGNGPGNDVRQRLAGLGYLDTGGDAPSSPVPPFALPPPGDTTTPLPE